MEERREHVRQPVTQDAFAVRAGRPCRLADLSRGGLGIFYFGEEDLDEEVRLDLVHATKNLYVEGVRCRKVTDVRTGRVKMFSYITDRRIGLQFLDPAPEVLAVLEHFVCESNREV